jgi:hypothetical protein
MEVLKNKLQKEKMQKKLPIRDIPWKWKMSKKGLICLYKSYCMSILMYGAESGTWYTADISRLTATQVRFLSTEQKKKGENKELHNQNLKINTLKGKLTNRRRRYPHI